MAVCHTRPGNQTETEVEEETGDSLRRACLAVQGDQFLLRLERSANFTAALQRLPRVLLFRSAFASSKAAAAVEDGAARQVHAQ